MSKPQFPMGRSPSEMRKDWVSPENTAYGNDLVLQHLNAELGDWDVEEMPPSLRGATDNRIQPDRSWYYPGGRGQGKLFHDPKPVAEHRWPRGYDPERHATAMEISSVQDVGRKRTGTEQHKWVADVLARSSADIDTFRYSTAYSEDPNAKGRPLLSFNVVDDPKHPDYTGKNKNRAGFHQLGRISVSRAASGDNDYAEQTLMHEVGHADSWMSRQFNVHDWATATGKGAEEARADVFAYQHHVPRRDAKSQSREHDYDPTRGYGLRGPDKRDFANAYIEEHHRLGVQTPSERTFLAREEASRRQHEEALRPTNKGQMPGQDLLWMRQVDTSETNAERDYGQWPIQAHDAPYSEHMATIRVGRGVPPQGWRGKDVTPERLRAKRDQYDPDEEVAKRARRWWTDRSS